MTNVLIVIGFAIVIVLLIMNLMKKDHTRELSRIEKGIEDNTRTLLEDKANKEAYEKSFAMILSETMKTREYLGVSDAKLSRIATSVNAMNNIMVNNKKRGNFGEYTLYGDLDDDPNLPPSAGGEYRDALFTEEEYDPFKLASIDGYRGGD